MQVVKKSLLWIFKKRILIYLSGSDFDGKLLELQVSPSKKIVKVNRFKSKKYFSNGKYGGVLEALSPLTERTIALAFPGYEVLDEVFWWGE